MSKKQKNLLAVQAANKLAAEYAAAAAPYDPQMADFEWVGSDASSREAIARPSTSFWQDGMRRLFKNKVAIVCIVVLALIILAAVFVPILSPFTYSEQHVTHSNEGMFFTCPDTGHIHLCGTDDLGRDIFVRLWEGARVSLTIAFVAVLVNCVVGLTYGGISGYFGGWLDNVMMRVVEVINGIPYMIVVILLMMVLDPGMGAIIVAYSLVGWTGMARLVRGQIVALKEQEFVIAAQAMGAKPSRIIAKHLLPNLLSVVIVNVTLAIPSVIFSEAFLSFIGLGVPIPMSSWGTLANDAIIVFRSYPMQLFLPSLCICLTMLGFNLLGDALRDAFDPKLRR